MISLLDVNLLLALAWQQHPHNATADQWFVQHSNSGWATCLVTESALLRLLQNRKIVTPKLDCQSALNALSRLTAHPDHHFIEQAPSLLDPPFDELVPKITGHKQMSDAVLLHLARVHGLKLVTFDKSITTFCPWPAQLEIVVP